MESPTLPRFVLKPWEFEGVAHSPFADAVVRCRWNEREVTMRLKVRENLLFFAPQGERDGRLFACTVRVDVSEEAANLWKARPEALRAKFAAALARNNWGRCVFVRYARDSAHSPQLPVIMATVRLDGRVWMRQLFDDVELRSWVEWDNLPNFGLELSGFARWPHAALRRYLQSQIARELRATLDRRVSGAANTRRTFGPLWTRGDETTLRRWLTWATQISPFVSGLQLPRVPVSRDVVLTVHAGTLAYAPFISQDVNASVIAPPLAQRLWNLILREQRVYAFASRHKSYNELQGFTRFHLTISSASSHHQRMEAYLNLRDAVRGTSIEGQVGAILSSLTVS